MDLKNWFNLRFRNRIFISTAILLVMQIAVVMLFSVNQSKQFKKDMSNVADTVSIGISQKNHELFVSTLMSAAERWQVSKIELCYGTKQVFALPTYNENCLNSHFETGFFRDEVKVQGFNNVRLRVTRLPFQTSQLIILLFTSACILSLLVTTQIRSISMSIRSDLLAPLANNLVESSPLEIRELEDLRLSLLSWKDRAAQVAHSEARSTLAAQVAHDIRSPLSAITAALSSETEIDKERIALVKKASVRISDIANDLLRSSSFQSNKLLNPPRDNVDTSFIESLETADLSELVREIFEEKKISVGNTKTIQLRLDIADDSEFRCKIDRPEFLRALSNLTNNAIESLNGTGKVVLAVRNANDSSSVVILDDGKGIPEDLIDRLGNERFSFGKEGTSSGSGLGLVHAKSSIERMRGRISIQSRVGAGTMITMTFPRA